MFPAWTQCFLYSLLKISNKITCYALKSSSRVMFSPAAVAALFCTVSQSLSGSLTPVSSSFQTPAPDTPNCYTHLHPLQSSPQPLTLITIY